MTWDGRSRFALCGGCSDESLQGLQSLAGRLHATIAPTSCLNAFERVIRRLGNSKGIAGDSRGIAGRMYVRRIPECSHAQCPQSKLEAL